MTAVLERPSALVWDVEYRDRCTGRYASDDDVRIRVYSDDTLVARGELLVGTIYGAPGIWGVFVDEAYRGQGYAREVMRRLIKKATDRGYSEVLLKVESDNDAAIGLYKSLGFTVEERDAGTGSWGVKYDVTIMRLVI